MNDDQGVLLVIIILIITVLIPIVIGIFVGIYLGIRYRKMIKRGFQSTDKTNELLEKIVKEDNSIPDQIQKLADLNRSGVITNEEFQIKKSELLKRKRTGNARRRLM